MAPGTQYGVHRCSQYSGVCQGDGVVAVRPNHSRMRVEGMGLVLVPIRCCDKTLTKSNMANISGSQSATEGSQGRNCEEALFAGLLPDSVSGSYLAFLHDLAQGMVPPTVGPHRHAHRLGDCRLTVAEAKGH